MIDWQKCTAKTKKTAPEKRDMAGWLNEKISATFHSQFHISVSASTFPDIRIHSTFFPTYYIRKLHVYIYIYIRWHWSMLSFYVT